MITRAIALLSERLLGIPKPKSLPPFIFFKNQNGQKNFKKHHGENSHHSFIDIGVKTDLQEGSETWKSVWDVKTVSGSHHGSKQTKIIKSFWKTHPSFNKTSQDFRGDA